MGELTDEVLAELERIAEGSPHANCRDHRSSYAALQHLPALLAAVRERDALLDALEPFALIGDDLGKVDPNQLMDPLFTVEDFRTAYIAWSKHRTVKELDHG
jgi:hypothetical protein